MSRFLSVMLDLKKAQKKEFIDPLKLHAFIAEMYDKNYNNDTSYIINEQKSSSILEAYGLFLGAKDIANEIVKQSEKSNEFCIIGKQLKTYNVFFKILYVSIEYLKDENDVSYGEYQVLQKTSKFIRPLIYDEKEDVMNNIIIKFHIKKDETLKDNYDIILHELVHAYEDYNRFKKDYTPTIVDISNIHKLEKLITTDDDAYKFVSAIIYSSESYERNAFVGQLHGILEGKKFKNITELFEYLKSDKLWQNLLLTHSLIDSLCNKNFNHKKEVIRLLRNVYNYDGVSDDKMLKTIKDNYDKFMSRLRSTIGKIAMDHIEH